MGARLQGEVIDSEQFNWFFQRFGHSRLPAVNYSGGTEASEALVASVPCRPIKPCSFNSTSPEIDTYVVYESGARIVGAEGEMVEGSPFIGMTNGPWNEATRYMETYWSAHPGMWTHGDLAVEENDGSFFILGRSYDALKIAGKRVGPAELEALAQAVTGAAQVARQRPSGILSKVRRL